MKPAHPRLRSALAVSAMIAGVVAVYVPVELLDPGKMLIAGDHLMLHAHRIRYAQEHLFGRGHTVPGWYSRELLGAPFWSNVQSFPFIPTRLPLLFMDADRAFAFGAVTAAVLASVFTFLFLRRVKLGPVAAAIGGWTFACCGFFSARLVPGHLPLLEAYPALPLLLWLGHRFLGGSSPSRVLALGGAAAAIALAGHPQLPIYALAAAVAFLWWQAWPEWRRALHGSIVIAAGLLVSGFATVPMALLSGRSTRVLALDTAGNDFSLPFDRLDALLLPWNDGWPEVLKRGTSHAFESPRVGLFWDTTCYAGVLAIAAVVALGVYALKTHPRSRTTGFIVAMASVALVLALPPVDRLVSLVPGIFLRSSARLLYLVSFALAAAVAAGCELLLRWAGGAPVRVAASVAILAVHVFDLAGFSRTFVLTVPTTPWDEAEKARVLAVVGDGRASVDVNVSTTYGRPFDDVGFFDSIMLASAYAGVLDLAGLPEGLNEQVANGSDLGRRVLEYAGVRLVVTREPVQGLPGRRSGELFVQRVPNAAPRASVFSEDEVLWLSKAELRARLRDPAFDARTALMLEGSPRAGPMLPTPARGRVRYARPEPDRILLSVEAEAPSYVKVVEAHDAGWSARVNGTPAPVLAADGMVMAVPVPAGKSEVELAFRTPGAATGGAVTLLGLALLAALAIRTRSSARVPRPHFVGSSDIRPEELGATRSGTIEV